MSNVKQLFKQLKIKGRPRMGKAILDYLDPKYGGRMILRNVGEKLPIDATLYPTTLKSFNSVLKKANFSRSLFLTT
jgi:hypothetical protein